MSKISNFSIDTTLMSSGEVSRTFTVKGKVGAKFFIVALQDATLKYYNFETDTFDLGHAPKSNLSITLNSNVFKGQLTFPDGAGNYVVKLLTTAGTLVKNGSSVISKTIEKQGTAATITFSPATVNTANYSTFPTSTSQGSITDASKISYKWTINNASTDAGGFGLKHVDITGVDQAYGKGVLALNPESYFYIQATKAIVTNGMGDGVDSFSVSVADTTGISIGMELFYHKTTVTPVTSSGAAVTGCVIIGIDKDSGKITFSKEVAFEDGETMTLRAYGTKAMYFASGVKFDFSEISVFSELLVKTVRAGGSGTTINLTDTHGISGGNTISYVGLGVDNSSANSVNVVTPDCPDPSDGTLDNDGQITVQLSQTLTQGTLLTFKGCFKEVVIKGEVKVDSHPTSDTTINLDLDKILTPGVSGS